jgi:hypothetical protein
MGEHNMKLIPEKAPYDACLPPAECSHEVYDAIAALAKKNKISKAEVIRQAIQFFLTANSHEVGVKVHKNGSNNKRASETNIAG